MASVFNSTLLSAALALTCQTAVANIGVSFNESAPKDWFEISNHSECKLKSLQLQIDLSKTAGKLIFDTTANGQGVEVFQPFEVWQGNIALTSSDAVNDGDTFLSITIRDLDAGESASFTIDVDDTLKNSELGMIRVSDAEIFGGELLLKTSDAHVVTGSFGSNGKTILPLPSCS